MTVWLSQNKVVVTHFWPHKKINKKKSKIQEDIHEESLEDCSSWRWKTKITSGKVGWQACIKLAKLTTQFRLTNDLFGENIFRESNKFEKERTKRQQPLFELRSYKTFIYPGRWCPWGTSLTCSFMFYGVFEHLLHYIAIRFDFD
jgi:hypothetical protein